MEKVEKVKVIKFWSQVLCALFSFLAAALLYSFWVEGYSRLVVVSLLVLSGLAIVCYLLSYLSDYESKRLGRKEIGSQ